MTGRKEKSKNSYRIVMRISEGKIHLRRQRGTSMGNIELDLREIVVLGTG